MEHNTEDRLRVGVITSSHGIKGEVKVYPTTDDNDRFKTLKKCYLSNGRETLEVNCTSCKFLKNMVILKFKEYDNINDIERFKNYDILVDRENAVPLMDGEFFICDVLDADVYDQNDEHIGILDDVLETPANDVFVVKKDDGSEILIPVVPDFMFEHILGADYEFLYFDTFPRDGYEWTFNEYHGKGHRVGKTSYRSYKYKRLHPG